MNKWTSFTVIVSSISVKISHRFELTYHRSLAQLKENHQTFDILSQALYLPSFLLHLDRMSSTQLQAVGAGWQNWNRCHKHTFFPLLIQLLFNFQSQPVGLSQFPLNLLKLGIKSRILCVDFCKIIFLYLEIMSQLYYGTFCGGQLRFELLNVKFQWAILLDQRIEFVVSQSQLLFELLVGDSIWLANLQQLDFLFVVVLLVSFHHSLTLSPHFVNQQLINFLITFYRLNLIKPFQLQLLQSLYQQQLSFFSLLYFVFTLINV